MLHSTEYINGIFNLNKTKTNRTLYANDFAKGTEKMVRSWETKPNCKMIERKPNRQQKPALVYLMEWKMNFWEKKKNNGNNSCAHKWKKATTV